MSPLKKEQKKWKPKFPGQQNDGEEDSYVKAQRLVNVYRQLHVLREDLVKRYNETLLAVDSDTRVTLTDIPGGRDVRNYLEYLETETYGEDFHHDDEEDVFVSREEKAKAKAIADALTSAQEKMTQNQLQAMQQAQDESRKNMEMLARTLAEARQDPSRKGEIEGLAQSLKKAKEDYTTYAEKINESVQTGESDQGNVQSIMRAQYQQMEAGVAAPVAQVPVAFDFSSGGAEGMQALVTAITEAQTKSAEVQAKMQSETMAKIFSQSQEMTARAMAEAFSKSQQNAAEVQGAIIAKALSESQKNANETLTALFAAVQKSGGGGGGPQIVIENSNSAQAGIQTNELLKQQAEAMAEAQREAQKELLKSQKELLDAQKKAILESTAKGTPMPMFGAPSMGMGVDSAEQAKMIAEIISKTQTALLSETMSELIHRQEESQRFQATLMAEAFTKQTKAITDALTESQRSVRKETLENQAKIVAEAMFNAQKETQKETVAAQATAIARAINSAHNETQSKVFADQARAMAEALAETNKEALAEQARVVAEAQSAVQQEALASQARVVAEAVAQKQNANLSETIDIISQKQMSQTEALAEALSKKKTTLEVVRGAIENATDALAPVAKEEKKAPPPIEEKEKKRKWHIPKMDLSAFTAGLEKAYASLSNKSAPDESDADDSWGYGYAEPPPPAACLQCAGIRSRNVCLSDGTDG